MANFEAYQEYQRIEDFEEDSPPGEEDLLLHVPEGLKGKHLLVTITVKIMSSCYNLSSNLIQHFQLSHDDVFFPDSWHHIKNLDNFFTRISFSVTIIQSNYFMIDMILVSS